jgi:hypothetical protein
MAVEGRARTWAEWAQEYQVYFAIVLANWTTWIEAILKSLRPVTLQIESGEVGASTSCRPPSYGGSLTIS